MSDANHREYHLTRAQAARERSARATHPQVQDVHTCMAAHHELLARYGTNASSACPPLERSVEITVKSSLDALVRSQSLLRQTNAIVRKRG
jgi:hypothetical protein